MYTFSSWHWSTVDPLVCKGYYNVMIMGRSFLYFFYIPVTFGQSWNFIRHHTRYTDFRIISFSDIKCTSLLFSIHYTNDGNQSNFMFVIIFKDSNANSFWILLYGNLSKIWHCVIVFVSMCVCHFKRVTLSRFIMKNISTLCWSIMIRMQIMLQ